MVFLPEFSSWVKRAEKSKRYFGIETKLLAKDLGELVKLLEVSNKYEKEEKEEDQELRIFINLKKYLSSESFALLPNKKKMGLMFYTLIHLAYRKNRVIFLDNVDYWNKGSNGEDFSNERILSLFAGEGFDFDHVMYYENGNKIGYDTQKLSLIWFKFLELYDNTEYINILNQCLEIWHNCAIEYAKTSNNFVNPDSQILWKEARADQFFIHEVIAGINTMFQVCRPVIDLLNDPKNQHYFNDNNKQKIEIAERSLAYVSHFLATHIPNMWQSKIIKSEFTFFKVKDRKGANVFVIAPKALKRFFMIHGIALTVFHSYEWFFGDGFLKKANKEHQGCPAAFHPIFNELAKKLFAKYL